MGDVVQLFDAPTRAAVAWSALAEWLRSPEFLEAVDPNFRRDEDPA
jgi:hypothetical protein